MQWNGTSLLGISLSLCSSWMPGERNIHVKTWERISLPYKTLQRRKKQSLGVVSTSEPLFHCTMKTLICYIMPSQFVGKFMSNASHWISKFYFFVKKKKKSHFFRKEGVTQPLIFSFSIPYLKGAFSNHCPSRDMPLHIFRDKRIKCLIECLIVKALSSCYFIVLYIRSAFYFCISIVFMNLRI